MAEVELTGAVMVTPAYLRASKFSELPTEKKRRACSRMEPIDLQPMNPSERGISCSLRCGDASTTPRVTSNAGKALRVTATKRSPPAVALRTSRLIAV